MLTLTLREIEIIIDALVISETCGYAVAAKSKTEKVDPIIRALKRKLALAIGRKL